MSNASETNNPATFVDPRTIRINRPCSESPTLGKAAERWYSMFGLQILPVLPGQKRPAVDSWDGWLADLSGEKVKRHWEIHPDHDIGCLMGDDLIMFDADTTESIANLVAVEESFGIKPKLLVKTARGQHHWFRRKPGTFASPDGHDSEKHPGRIDIRTGRSMAILPPSTNKVAIVHDANHVSELTEVCQSFIDAVYLMNDREPPRPMETMQVVHDRVKGETHSVAKLKALLDHLDPDCGYQDWLNVLMAVHTETGGSDEGLALVDEWSRKGSKYAGQQELSLKWRSFKNNLGRSITIGTINNMVKAAGYSWQEIVEPFEGFEVVDDVADPPTDQPDVAEANKEEGTVLDKYSLTGLSAELEKQAVEQVPVLGQVALMGQLTAFYAEPNTGKTLVTLKLIIEAIELGRINPAKAYYLNMDDTSQGLLDKVRIAEDYGFQMLAEGYREFKAKSFLENIREMIERKQARGTLIILDTLKKFVDLMKKSKCSDFNNVLRQFATNGGTLIALAHTNKNKGLDGKPVPCGTSDVRDDYDCVYIMSAISQPGSPEKVVLFEKDKRRGNVVDRVAYSYADRSEISYDGLLMSVQVFDETQVDTLVLAEAFRSDEELISAATACIGEGVASKMLLAKAVSERSGVSRKTSLQLIERYTGDDPARHRWQAKRGAHGKLVYELLDMAPADGLPVTTQDNEDQSRPNL